MNQRSFEESRNDLPWINPVGGYGDMLMVSGVLKQVAEQDSSKRFNLLRRTMYLDIFNGHEAIADTGFPKKGEKILGVDYWSMEELGPGNQRAYQVLARAFGLSTPVEERLYLPNIPDSDPLLHDFLTWKDLNVIIAPASDSPRKEMPSLIWHRLVDHLQDDGTFVMQVGLLRNQHIKNAYSLRGLTNPRQLITLLKKCDIVITVDNFIMHAAHLAGTPAVVVWGPTQHEVYGYPDQIHLQMPFTCKLDESKSCIVSRENQNGRLYGTECPLGERHCLNQIKPETIYKALQELLVSRR